MGTQIWKLEGGNFGNRFWNMEFDVQDFCLIVNEIHIIHNLNQLRQPKWSDISHCTRGDEGGVSLETNLETGKGLILETDYEI